MPGRRLRPTAVGVGVTRFRWANAQNRRHRCNEMLVIDVTVDHKVTPSDDIAAQQIGQYAATASSRTVGGGSARYSPSAGGRTADRRAASIGVNRSERGPPARAPARGSI